MVEEKKQKLNFILEELYYKKTEMIKFKDEINDEKIKKGYKFAIYDFEQVIKNINRRFDNYNVAKNQELIIKTHKREPIPKGLRTEVFERDNYKCVFCGALSKTKVLHIDHIIPVSEGGKSKLSNLQSLCEDCNLDKSNRVI